MNFAFATAFPLKHLPSFVVDFDCVVVYLLSQMNEDGRPRLFVKHYHDPFLQALDGDMQMLVYENYNKFISATETIKRMKNNVDAMDGDMEAVR